MFVKKRDGRFVAFDRTKIDTAVGNACKEVGVDPIILSNTEKPMMWPAAGISANTEGQKIPDHISASPEHQRTPNHENITEYSLFPGGVDVNNIALKDRKSSLPSNITLTEEDMKNAIIGPHCVLIRINDDGFPYMDIEDIQDAVELALMERNPWVAQAYIRYRHERMLQRNLGHNILDDIARITNLKAVDNEQGRDNANVNEDVTMGWMLHAGEIATKAYFMRFRLKEEWTKAHVGGKIHIHDLAWLDKSINCLQIDLGTLMSKRVTDDELETKFFEELEKHDMDSNIAGAITHKFEMDRSTFSTGHGTIRIPSVFKTAMSLAAVIIQANQNDNYGGQGVPGIDFQMERFVHVDFRRELFNVLIEQLYIANKLDQETKDRIKSELADIEDPFNNTDAALPVVLKFVPLTVATRMIEVAYSNTHENVMQACEGFVHNLNTMSSRAGAEKLEHQLLETVA